MKKVVASLVVVAFAATSAFGGLVSFGPEAPSGMIEVAEGTNGLVDVGLLGETLPGGQYELADLVIGSMTAGLILDFTYTTECEGVTDSRTPPLIDAVGAYPSDAFVGFNNLYTTPLVGPSLNFGTLTLNTAGLGLGDEVTVLVDYGVDGMSRLGAGGVGEELYGSGTVKIVPEPATLVLLGIGGLVALRRRRSA